MQEDVEDLILRKRHLFFNEAFDLKEDLYLIDGVEELIKDLHANGMQLISVFSFNVDD